jgi:hypothetical protein
VSQKHDRLLWAAMRIERSLARRTRSNSAPYADVLATLLHRQQAVQVAWERFATAQSHGWFLAAHLLNDQLLNQIRRLHLDTGAVLARADEPHTPIPSVHELLVDLRQLSDEFEHIEVLPKEKMLVAHTPPIELEGLGLGPFAIQLHLDRLSCELGSRCFDCVALEPNRPGANDSVTHPHVKDDALCAGDAAVPIATALAQGRIADAFCLVKAVLENYNSESPYVSIGEWEGIRCSDCDSIVASDQLYHCDACGNDFCDECFSYCDLCEQSYCRSCLEQDRVSDQRCCPDCRTTCSECGRTVDINSFNNETDLCPECHAKHQEQERLSKSTSPENNHDPIPTTPEPQTAPAA